MTQQYEYTRQDKVHAVLAVIFVIAVIIVFGYKLNQGLLEVQTNEAVKQLDITKVAFAKGRVYVCQNSIMKQSSKYLVSAASGWEIYDGSYFKKGDLLLEMQYCQNSDIQGK